MRRAAAVLLVLWTAGCGGSSDVKSEPAAEIKDAVEKTLASGTARQTLSIRIPHSVNVTVRGSVDFDADVMKARVTYSKFPQLAAGSQTSVITADGIDYYRHGGSRKWIETKESDEIANALDLPTSLGYLAGLMENARSETGTYIDGRATTRYTASVGLERLLEALTPDQARLFEKQQAEFPEEALLDVSIDSEGLIRRVSYDIPSLPAIIGAPGPLPETTITLRLSHFGRPGRLAAPPSARIVPAR